MISAAAANRNQRGCSAHRWPSDALYTSSRAFTSRPVRIAATAPACERVDRGEVGAAAEDQPAAREGRERPAVLGRDRAHDQRERDECRDHRSHRQRPAPGRSERGSGGRRHGGRGVRSRRSWLASSCAPLPRTFPRDREFGEGRGKAALVPSSHEHQRRHLRGRGPASPADRRPLRRRRRRRPGRGRGHRDAPRPARACGPCCSTRAPAAPTRSPPTR